MEFEVYATVTYKALDGKMKIHFIKDSNNSTGIFEFKSLTPNKTIAIPQKYINDAIKILDCDYDSFMIAIDYSVYQLTVQKIGKDDKPLFTILKNNDICYTIHLEILKEMINVL